MSKKHINRPVTKADRVKTGIVLAMFPVTLIGAIVGGFALSTIFYPVSLDSASVATATKPTANIPSIVAEPIAKASTPVAHSIPGTMTSNNSSAATKASAPTTKAATPKPPVAKAATPAQPAAQAPAKAPSATIQASGAVTAPPASGPAGPRETAWKSGASWLAAPASANLGAYLNGKSATDFLHSIPGTDPDVRVVVTKNPVNCGYTSSFSDRSVAGCYDPKYGKVVFLYWGANSPASLRTLVLLHEYSHFVQNWNYYSTIISGYATPSAVPGMSHIIETDATCRVYYGWGYSSLKSIDSWISSPCGNTAWSNDWLRQQITALGVKIITR
jgi:hypothetical protein